MNQLNQLFAALTQVAVLFLAISWTASKLVELGQSLCNSHGNVLLSELTRYFGDEAGGKMTEYFFWHPLIEPLVQPSIATSGIARLRNRIGIGPSKGLDLPKGRLPERIAPSTFAAVILNPFPWPTSREALERLLWANVEAKANVDKTRMIAVLDRVGDRMGKGPDDIDDGAREDGGGQGQEAAVPADLTWGQLLGSSRASCFKEAFCNTKVDLYPWDQNGYDEGGEESVLKPLRRVNDAWNRNAIVPDKLRSRVIALLRDSEHDIDLFRSNIANWYAEAMDRASARFKRSAIAWTFVVAFMLCFGFSISVFSVLAELWSDPAQGSIASAMKNVWEQIHTKVVFAPGANVWPGFGALAGMIATAMLAAFGAPFWYDVFKRLTGETKSSAKAG